MNGSAHPAPTGEVQAGLIPPGLDIPAMLAAGKVTTGLIAMLVKAELVGRADLPITAMDTMDAAGPGALTFIRSNKFAAGWAKSGASAALVTRGIEVPDHDPTKRALLIVPEADLALTTLIKLATVTEKIVPGIHPTAIIDPSAQIHPTATVGPHCIIAAGAIVSENCVLLSGVRIGVAARVGPRTRIGHNAAVGDRCVVGKDCQFHAGVVLGADGFGYRPSPDGPGVVKLPQLGNVVIGDDVEIGANSCIDRGRFGPTIIGDGSKIDNLVQIGHNVQIGKYVLICACVGIAGSVVIEDGTWIGGLSGVADNVHVGKGGRIAAFSGISTDVPDGQSVHGNPALPGHEWMRMVAWARRQANDRRTPRH